ncbi:cadherin-like protein 26 [Cyclopterus lumpus]|uniref:Cadherin domain-containing protein n=1 Tax=Cyclopterus lumpus TaxID=8103 RepID=A0A8C3A2V3_CYCLU|nr:cadherin-like protein 26 [Cyclopterus lumpus]
MRTVSLLLLVALTGLAESRLFNHLGPAKRELLVRSKRRWVLSTIEIDEEDPGPFPKEISKMYNDKKSPEGHLYRISGMGVDEVPKGVFSIDEYTGVVTAHKSVDREAHDLFEIHFDILNAETGKAIDRQLSFNVEVKDINDNAPFFDGGLQANVPENTVEGTPLIHLNMMDRDERNSKNSEVTVSMLSQNPLEPKIELNQITNRIAQLNFKGCFDYDKEHKYEIVLQVKDHGTPALSSTAVATIHILDKNSHMPTFRQKKYQGEVLESVTKEDILRIAVDDKDSPKTPGWRAKYFFIKGNEGRNYQLETDPETNEGILSVIKGKDFEKMKSHHLLVGVENEEPLFVCKNGSLGAPPSPDVADITIQVIDVNDPPSYEKMTYDVYRIEEEDPGQVLLTPKVIDDDSEVSKVRHELVEDPAGWVSIDEKTGTITTTKKMDRDSSFVHDSVYKIVIRAIDNGKPPAQCTATVLVHLRDINDNLPRLVNSSLVLCGNKASEVMVQASDADANPFSGPFTFGLGSDEKDLAERWKLDPSYGDEGGLVSRTQLPFGNYLVPLRIQDQQSLVGDHTVQVVVCDCGEGDVCLPKTPPSTSLGPAGIGLIFLGLLLFLLLLLVCKCQCRGKDFKHMPMVQDEGNQTLIRYNQEGGGSPCMNEPTLLQTPTKSMAVTEGLKMGNMQSQVTTQDMDAYASARHGMMTSNMTLQGSQRRRDTVRSQGGQSMNWNLNRMNSFQAGSSRDNHSVSMLSDQHISDHIVRRMDEINGNQDSRPVYQPHEYAYEGQGSKCQSLDQLSLSNTGDDLMFLNDLGPKFKTLAGVCNQTIPKRNTEH